MKKILCAVCAAVLFLLCGCSPLLNKEYMSITDYNAADDLFDEQEIGAISNYSALMDALENMVSQHQDSARLQFNNYAGNISDDLAEASWHIKSASALGAYMVDYISYDISRIVTYYQATVYINYARSAEDMEEIRSIGANKIVDTVSQAVAGGDEHLAIQVYTTAMDSEDMTNRIDSAILDSALHIPVIPNINIEVFSGESHQHIFEINFDYGDGDEEIPVLGARLEEAVKAAAEHIKAEEDYSIAILAAGVVGRRCEYDSAQTVGTAYDALVEGQGGSLAVSMAYSAICREKGLESHVVSGLKNNEQHYWCMVRVGDYWYHVDVPEAMYLPGDTVFLRTDAEMKNAFRWDELDYPTCDGPSLIALANAGEKDTEEEK